MTYTTRTPGLAAAAALAAAALAAAAACTDALDQRLAILAEPRVLAILAEPAEARPGATVTYRAIAGGPEGPLDAAPDWSYCTGSKPPTEDNAVSTTCASGAEVQPLGAAPVVTAALPGDACVRFGPEVPAGDFRPRDPDATGGFYQPIRAELAPLPLLAFGLSRITCKLPNATGEISRDYDLRYAANQNPVLVAPALATVPAHRDVELTASWPAESAETYLYFDRLEQRLIERREAMRLSWFATGGALDVDATAVGEHDLATSVSTTWRTPGPGPATLWFVLRDSRGGIAAAALAVTVE